jgi:hypothetical protein
LSNTFLLNARLPVLGGPVSTALVAFTTAKAQTSVNAGDSKAVPKDGVIIVSIVNILPVLFWDEISASRHVDFWHG